MEDNSFHNLKIGIAGLGLIGGSLAMAFKKAGYFVTGYDRDKTTVEAAADCGAVDEGSTDPDTILCADCLFIALYPDDIISFVKQNAAKIKKGAIVIDCCGVKEYITQALEPIVSGRDFFFIGGHPMAGAEKTGFVAAREGLFYNASYILTPPEGFPADILEKVKEIIRSAGFKRIVITSAAHHDRMIAFTSQLPHVLACAYVKSECCPFHVGYSAGSYRDVSRVAHINPELWADLFLCNRNALVGELDGLIGHLTEIRDAVDSNDRDTLVGLLREARMIKDGVDFEH